MAKTKDIIDQLKKNKRQLILMNSELQHAMLSMHPKEFICLQDTSSLNDLKWEATVSDKWYVSENLYNTFQLCPDYEEPEPEIVEPELVLPAILAKLEEIRCGLIDIESAIEKGE